MDHTLHRWCAKGLRADSISVVTLMLGPSGPPRVQVLLSQISNSWSSYKTLLFLGGHYTKQPLLENIAGWEGLECAVVICRICRTLKVLCVFIFTCKKH
jgi:hypothetical protein